MQWSFYLYYTCTVTLEYFNFKRENEFERFVVCFYCFSDNCCWATAGGNEIDPQLNRHDHSFKGSLVLWASAFLLQVLVNTTSKTLWWPSLACGDLVWRCWPFAKGPLPVGYARLVVTCKPTHWCNFAGTQTLPSLDCIIHYYTSQLYTSYWSVCIMNMLISIVGVSIY